MQYNFENLVGKKFGRLTVVERAENDKYCTARWKCKCICGGETITSTTHLKSGHTKSCGCFAKEIAKEKALKNPHFYKHGLFKNSSYIRISHILNTMRKRCYNPNNESYIYYGFRGIKICNEWLDKENGLMNFYNWAMQNGYKDNLSIDRIDVNGNYEPSNCRWATAKEQCNNKRNNHYITYNGETHTMMEWSKILSISYNQLRDRIRRNWSIERAFNQPIGHTKTVLQYDLNGNFIKKYNSLTEAQNQTNIKTIGSCCRKKTNQAGGFVWRYENEYNNKFSNNCGEPE